MDKPSKPKAKILIPLPLYGFDPTEAAIPWKLLIEHNFNVVFATPNGKKAAGDKILLTGKNLGIFKSILMAREDAIEAYNSMCKCDAFKHPLSYEDIDVDDFEGIFLPGGHDKGVKEYIESDILRKVIPIFFEKNKKIGAICHGVMLLANCINKNNGKSVLYDYNTTSLLKIQERLAYYLTKIWLDDYYLTYPETTVEETVVSSLHNPSQFHHGNMPLFRDSLHNTRYSFVVEDRNYISARWPGDIYGLSLRYIKALNKIH